MPTTHEASPASLMSPQMRHLKSDMKRNVPLCNDLQSVASVA
ncbi:hypothetical protein PLANPX_3718 [Lacipirellula parvula]|uniref:Uncharacterized protein n=1 Tax=Lacipirellula parvula TaxID=2650471 RepID=A0A5K7XIG4_9BACT|nr:hypothetical protein PLANPX_3718 [Lacipirellula parvula]